MNFKDFNLTINNNITTINVGDIIINIKEYLSVADRYDLVSIVLQNSFESGIYNPVKMDMYYKLYTVYMYTDIEFDEEDRADEVKLYDLLESNGIIKAVFDAIDFEETSNNLVLISELREHKERQNGTLSYTINSLINNLPINAKDALEIVNKFNPEDFQRVLSFARAVNNGNNPK